MTDQSARRTLIFLSLYSFLSPTHPEVTITFYALAPALPTLLFLTLYNSDTSVLCLKKPKMNIIHKLNPIPKLKC